MGATEEEDIEFWTVYLSYLEQIQVDDLEAWSDEQLEYYQIHSHVEVRNIANRRERISRALAALRANPKLTR